MKHIHYTWEQFDEDCRKMAQWAQRFDFVNIYGIPRSGLIPATRVSHLLGVPLITDFNEIDPEATLVIDDSTNTGDTIETLREKVGDFITATLLWYEGAPEPDFYCMKKTSWVIFPWKGNLASDEQMPKNSEQGVVTTPASLKGSIRINKRGLA